MLRRFVLTTVALVAAVVAYALVTLPPKRITLVNPIPSNVVFGAYHVHTTRSDGTATPEAVAAAGARAGLAFVILTDHGDGTRVPDPPRYIDRVLVIDAVEISTDDGHVAALGLSGATPYRLAGEARDVIEDIHRLGGFAVVAHPDSPKPSLRWRGAGGVPGNIGGGFGGRGGGGGDLAGADGIEWLSADTEWRDDRWPALANTALHLPIRPAESLALLLVRPAATLRRWDALTRRQPVVGLAAADAHGLVGNFYESTFLSFAQAAVLERPLNGDPLSDAQGVVDALRAGHSFSIVSGIAGPASPVFTVSDGVQTAVMGDHLSTSASRIQIIGAVDGARGARAVLLHDGREIQQGPGAFAFSRAPDPGAYRMEVWLGRAEVPWIVTNPVYVGAPPIPPAPPAPASIPAVILTLVPGMGNWAVEHGPSSSGEIAADGGGLRFEYRVGVNQPGLEYSALARSISDGVEAFDRLEFTARADRPMRISVQFRFPGGRDGERWARSVFLDRSPRAVVVRMQDVQPVGFPATRRPIAARVKSLLLVVDTVNTATGTSGTIWLEQVRLVKSPSGTNGQQQVGRSSQEQQVRRPSRENRRQ